MKNIYLSKIVPVFLLTVLLGFNRLTLHAQTIDTAAVKYKRAENIYLEAIGAGLVFSANYDTRFAESRNGLGARIGVGFFSSWEKYFTVPVQINYLIGKKSNFAELGAGATYILFKGHDYVLFPGYQEVAGNRQAVFATTTIGYRYQPVNGGINFRISANPIFNSNLFAFGYGLSVGYTFK